MSDTKIFSFPEQSRGGFGGGSAMEGAMLGSMMGNGGMMGGGGMWNNPWWALIFLAAFRGNGGLFGGDGNNGNGGNGATQARFDALQEQLNTIQGQNALMAAITGGTSEIKALAGTLNCDINAVQAAINAVQTAICNLQNSGNMNAQSIITAVNSGDQGIIRQIDELLTKHNIKLEHSKGYDYVYAANYAKARFLKSSIADEKSIAQYVKDVIDDPTLPGGNEFRKWCSECDAKGEPVEWEDIL